MVKFIVFFDFFIDVLENVDNYLKGLIKFEKIK